MIEWFLFGGQCFSLILAICTVWILFRRKSPLQFFFILLFGQIHTLSVCVAHGLFPFISSHEASPNNVWLFWIGPLAGLGPWICSWTLLLRLTRSWILCTWIFIFSITVALLEPRMSTSLSLALLSLWRGISIGLCIWHNERDPSTRQTLVLCSLVLMSVFVIFNGILDFVERKPDQLLDVTISFLVIIVHCFVSGILTMKRKDKQKDVPLLPVVHQNREVLGNEEPSDETDSDYEEYEEMMKKARFIRRNRERKESIALLRDSPNFSPRGEYSQSQGPSSSEKDDFSGHVVENPIAYSSSEKENIIVPNHRQLIHSLDIITYFLLSRPNRYVKSVSNPIPITDKPLYKVEIMLPTTFDYSKMILLVPVNCTPHLIKDYISRDVHIKINENESFMEDYSLYYKDNGNIIYDDTPVPRSCDFGIISETKVLLRTSRKNKTNIVLISFPDKWKLKPLGVEIEPESCVSDVMLSLSMSVNKKTDWINFTLYSREKKLDSEVCILEYTRNNGKNLQLKRTRRTGMKRKMGEKRKVGEKKKTGDKVKRSKSMIDFMDEEMQDATEGKKMRRSNSHSDIPQDRGEKDKMIRIKVDKSIPRISSAEGTDVVKITVLAKKNARPRDIIRQFEKRLNDKGLVELDLGSVGLFISNETKELKTRNQLKAIFAIFSEPIELELRQKYVSVERGKEEEE